MKFPQTMLCIIWCLAIHQVKAQTPSLSTITAGIYYENSLPSLKSSLDSETHETLFSAFKAADLEDILGMKGPFTVFAPNNTAFETFTSEELTQLFKEENKKKLKALLTYHIVAGRLTASKILKALCRGKGKASFTSVQGTKITATISGSDIILSDLQGREARITSADATQSNGVIHEIDAVIQPGL